MTEVYEYAMGLSSAASLVSFQPLKFIYACWLLDHGLVVQAYAYFELIAAEIIKGISMLTELGTVNWNYYS